MYVDTAELAAWLSIPDGLDDVALGLSVEAAESDVDRYCGWGSGAFAATTTATARVFAADDTYHLRLSCGFADTTGLIVRIDDNDDLTYEVTLAATDYELLPAGNRFSGVDGYPFFELLAVGDWDWPLPGDHRNRVQITARWGWAATPADVRQATLLRAGQIHLRRNSRNGIQQETGFRAGGRDRDWELMLNDYRHPSKMTGVA
jgi:hypothetical protein